MTELKTGGVTIPDYLRQGCLNHFGELSGFDELENVELRRGHVVNAIRVPAGMANLFSRAHGGFLMYLVDIAACMAGYSLGQHNVTQHVSIDFIHGVQLGELIFTEADVIHEGHHTAVVQTRIYNEDHRLCVDANVTLFFVGEVDPLAPPPRMPQVGPAVSATDDNAL